MKENLISCVFQWICNMQNFQMIKSKIKRISFYMVKLECEQKRMNRRQKDFNGINKQSELQTMRNAFLIFLAIIMVIQVETARTFLDRSTQFPYSGTILRTSYGDEFQVDFSGVAPEAEINIKFVITTHNVLTTTFLAVDYNETRFKSGKIAPVSLYGVNYTAVSENMDIAMLQLGKTQYIYRKKFGDRDNILYFTVYNLDPQFRCVDINYTIYIDIDTFYGLKMDCYPCVNAMNVGRRRNSSSCICDTCVAGYYGPDCSINMTTLTKGLVSSTVLDGPGMAFFTIQQINEVDFLVKTSVGQAEIYFQFIDFEGQFASYTNVAKGKVSEGRFNVTGGTGGTGFTAISSGSRMSLTVAVYQDVTTTIDVIYSVNEKSNVLLIVLAVLGSVLFIGLVIAGVYIYRNSTWFQNNRESRQIRPMTQNLNDEEIERFFPTVVLKNISLNYSAESSNIQFNQSPSKPKMQIQDCVICLCPIQPQQSIKVTYCKHIFHGQCLVGWFMKQQNCPYCRQEFTKTNSIKLYKKVKESRGVGVIKGEDLVNAILSQQKSVVPSNNSIDMLQQKQPQKIKIGSRVQVQIQNLS